MSSELLPSIPGLTGYLEKRSNASEIELQPSSISMTPSSRWSMKTVAPGFMPSLSRNAFGMTTWPLGPTFQLTEAPNGDRSIPCTSCITTLLQYNHHAK